MELDCLGVVSKIKLKELDRSVFGPLIKEIKHLLHEFDDYSVVHVQRSDNEVANHLAKFSCENSFVRPGLGFLLSVSYPCYL